MSAAKTSLLRQSGVAIIAVLMVAALVASIAGLLMLRQQRALQQLEIRKDTAEARAATWSVLQLVRLTLRDDARQGEPDHLLKPWAIPIPEIKVENGALSGRLVELNGRFNVNNLITSDGQLDMAALAAYRQLMINLSLSPNLADGLQKYLTEHALKTGDKVKLQPLLDLTELANVAGYDAATLRNLEANVVALPVSTPLNVNFVSAEVLAAWMPKLGVSGAEQALSRRRSKYFASVDDFVALLPTERQAEVPRQLLAVKSSYFWADMGARFGSVFMQHRALLDRSKAELPTVLWLRRSY
ncbi:type II secretion system minor pseudopilin GspK [Chitinibacter bivalviorum]|uniref:Type II secretion system protein K n=1 Tax=Chitinibacter bivalviorum TaxID=2739434 RepID=A0A7H9BLG0_9NEIS|nr:type II secretion system minor pseudopilin GspK [Chitinibacter bivalviorum]QLG89517.1 type II secretion system minor pseudopilin GspK [Chitinibacter bivalviorum]